MGVACGPRFDCDGTYFGLAHVPAAGYPRNLGAGPQPGSLTPGPFTRPVSSAGAVAWGQSNNSPNSFSMTNPPAAVKSVSAPIFPIRASGEQAGRGPSNQLDMAAAVRYSQRFRRLVLCRSLITPAGGRAPGFFSGAGSPGPQPRRLSRAAMTGPFESGRPGCSAHRNYIKNVGGKIGPSCE